MKIRWRYQFKIRWICNSSVARYLKVNAIVLYPFIFVKHASASPQLTAHELEHVLQMRREGVAKFYAKYLWFYFQNLRKYKNSHIAYLNIPYEVEARAAEAVDGTSRDIWPT